MPFHCIRFACLVCLLALALRPAAWFAIGGRRSLGKDQLCGRGQFAAQMVRLSAARIQILEVVENV